MGSLQTYIDSPYILTEDEIRSKPFGDILELTKYIEEVTREISHNLKIHVENVKMLNKMMLNKLPSHSLNQTTH